MKKVPLGIKLLALYLFVSSILTLYMFVAYLLKSGSIEWIRTNPSIAMMYMLNQTCIVSIGLLACVGLFRLKRWGVILSLFTLIYKALYLTGVNALASLRGFSIGYSTATNATPSQFESVIVIAMSIIVQFIIAGGIIFFMTRYLNKRILRKNT
jgi:hypothetical protein